METGRATPGGEGKVRMAPVETEVGTSRKWRRRFAGAAVSPVDRGGGVGQGSVARKRSAHQLPSLYCGRISKVVPNGSTLYYRSASNRLLARTTDRTPKRFTLQGDPSRPTTTPSSKRSPYIVFPAARDVTWNALPHSGRIFSPNRDIEKISAPLRFHISSPKSPRSGVQTWLLPVISYLPL
ncbi:hypothetical protein AVEN_14236-1 [Araneus ventricosus]|uniref:Uncharacterized protein n=1 Tax=Araneus ventricosus TaxID=182803 RepID=A0A4Y2GIN2_ARAVE|nr:hypothetical protein AVEN_14236-1 [Araneus ventricosus]